MLQADGVVQLVGMLMEGRLDQEHGEALMHLLHACVQVVQNQRIQVMQLRGMSDCHCVSLDEIAWIEAEGSYTLLHMADSQVEVLSFNINCVYRVLQAAGRKQFVRIHRSSIINMYHVRRVIGHSVLIEAATLKVTRKYWDDFKQHILYVGRRS